MPLLRENIFIHKGSVKNVGEFLGFIAVLS